MISNVDYPTTGGHMTSPDTQTNWNGILGEISLNIFDAIQIQEVQLYPSINERTVKAVIKLDNFSDVKEATLKILVNLREKDREDNSQEYKLETECVKKELHKGINEVEVTYEMKEPLMLWDEYYRNLYDFNITVLGQEQEYDYKKVTFGFRDFKTNKRDFEVNGKKTFLRGKHDGMIFPLTGYAPMDKEEWLRVFGIAKDYGINHYRFQTCCPPKAAFEAADEIGMYLQPEIPFWGTILAEGAEGYDSTMQNFLLKEGDYILQEFGNHPSFVMMSMGNELWGDKKAIREMVEHYKK